MSEHEPPEAAQDAREDYYLAEEEEEVAEAGQAYTHCCQVCPASFKDLGGLRKHLNDHISNAKTNETPCEESEYESWWHSHEKKDHQPQRKAMGDHLFGLLVAQKPNHDKQQFADTAFRLELGLYHAAVDLFIFLLVYQLTLKYAAAQLGRIRGPGHTPHSGGEDIRCDSTVSSPARREALRSSSVDHRCAWEHGTPETTRMPGEDTPRRRVHRSGSVRRGGLLPGNQGTVQAQERL
jgi:hypothetical protein